MKKIKKAKKIRKVKATKATRPTKKTKSVQKRDTAALSPEADRWLADAVAEFKAKQDALDREWGFNSFERWTFDQPTRLFSLQFTDGTQFEADGLILGTYCPGDSSWEWAWNNPNVQLGLAVPRETLAEIGTRLGVEYLTIGMVPAPTRQVATYLCALGVKATGAIGVYLGGEGPVEAAILLTNPRRKLKAA